MPFTYSHSNKSLPRRPKQSQVYLDILHILNDDEDDESYGDDCGHSGKKPWRPITLHAGFLAGVALITLALIIGIIFLLLASQHNQGALFAQDINELPLNRSVAYLYLPTLVSVLYSFLWTWVILDIKRLEPYFQLSKPGGATGSSSLLFGYPLQFLLTLPFLAYKHKHWSVFATAVAMMLVFWGLTPIQAGIFATRSIAITEHIPAAKATSFTLMSTVYAQSAYNIAWLNETLPPYITKDYVLHGYGPRTAKNIDSTNITYMADTRKYSVDVDCEDVVLWDGPGGTNYNASSRCSFYAPPIRPYGGNDNTKRYDTMYIGYQNQDGAADYYLSSSCNESFLHSFFIRWSKSTAVSILSGNLSDTVDLASSNSTALF